MRSRQLTLELATTFKKAVGVDLSKNLINAAKVLLKDTFTRHQFLLMAIFVEKKNFAGRVNGDLINVYKLMNSEIK